MKIMKKLWDYVNKNQEGSEHRWKKFVAANTLLWAGAVFAACLIFGGLFHFDSTWLEWTVTLSGTAGMSAGFFGGLIFAMNA